MNFHNTKMVFKTKTKIYQIPRVWFYFLTSLFPLNIPIIIDLLVLLEVLEIYVVDFAVRVVISSVECCPVEWYSVECCSVEVIMVVFAKLEM